MYAHLKMIETKPRGHFQQEDCMWSWISGCPPLLSSTCSSNRCYFYYPLHYSHNTRQLHGDYFLLPCLFPFCLFSKIQGKSPQKDVVLVPRKSHVWRQQKQGRKKQEKLIHLHYTYLSPCVLFIPEENIRIGFLFAIHVKDLPMRNHEV